MYSYGNIYLVFHKVVTDFKLPWNASLFQLYKVAATMLQPRNFRPNCFPRVIIKLANITVYIVTYLYALIYEAVL